MVLQGFMDSAIAKMADSERGVELGQKRDVHGHWSTPLFRILSLTSSAKASHALRGPDVAGAFSATFLGANLSAKKARKGFCAGCLPDPGSGRVACSVVTPLVNVNNTSVLIVFSKLAPTA